MYPVSADFHNLSIADAPTSRVRIYFIEANVDCTDDNDVQSNGTLLCMPGETDSNGRIEKGGVTINEFFNSDANVQIGATVSSQIGMTLINRDGALDGFNYGRCKLYIDVYDDTNSTWLTCPMGVYNIAIPKRRKVQLVSATGYDQMQQLDEIADSWWNGLDWSNGITLLQIIQSMAATLGIHLSANTSANIVNSGLSYTEIPFTAIEMTYRDILSYIAETTGTIARFDRNGALDLRWFSDAVLSTDTQTYAGGLVTFTATDRASISSLSVPFSPIQDLHGYASPWPGGGGKNIAPYSVESLLLVGYQSMLWENGYRSNSVTSTSTGFSFTRTDRNYGCGIVLGKLEEGQAYTIKATRSDPGWTCNITTFDADAVLSSTTGVSRTVVQSGVNIENGYTFIALGGNIKYALNFYDSAQDKLTFEVSNIQLEIGSTATSWSPYSNICHISGLTGLSAYRTGKNLYDNSLYYVGYYGQIWANGYNGRTIQQTDTGCKTNLDANYGFGVYLGYFKAGTEFTVSFSQSGIGTTAGNVVSIRKTTTNTLSLESGLSGTRLTGKAIVSGQNYITFTTDENCHYWLGLYDSTSGAAHEQELTNIQLELGSTDTTYESYRGNTYAFDWTSEAGTVYVGTLDVVTDVLTVNYIKQTITSVNLWGSSNPNGTPVYASVSGTAHNPAKLDVAMMRSNIFTYTQEERTTSPLYSYGGSSGAQATQTFILPSSVTTKAEANAWFAANPTECIFKLENPITYQLTAQEVEALVGTNNVWSTGDSVSVTVAEPNLVEIQTDTVGNQCLSIDVGEYQVSQIDALSVKASQADVGVTIGSGGNAYTILDNPMLFGDEAAITTKATPIYNRLSAFRLFTPISMRCIMDWSIEAGDIITVTNESVTYDLPIFQQRLRWRGGYVVSDLFSSGEQERPTQSKEIRSSFRSKTQMHEFEVTLEQLRSYIQSVDGNYTLIQQTVDAITQTVANQNVTIQNILDPTGEIWTAITKNTSNLSSIEDSLNNEITERKSYIRFIPSEPAIVMGVDEDNEIKLKLVNNIIYFFNGADDSTDLSLAYAYFNSQEAFADRFVAGESVQIGKNDNAAHWLWKKLNNGDLVLELVG